MVQTINNPFQTTEVFVPASCHEYFKQYCQRADSGGRGKRIDQSPFPRMVDMWYLAVCLAFREGLQPEDLGKQKPVEISKGMVFAEYPDMVYTLMLIAIQVSGDIDIVSKPRDMMKIANELASAGIPRVVGILEDGDGDPIWNLSDAIDRLLT